MEQLSLKKAKRLAIIKWEAHIKAGGCYENVPKEIILLTGHCGFCERWPRSVGCDKCEFGKLAGTCYRTGSLFNNWLVGAVVNKRLHYAQAILYAIKSIPDE